MITRGLIFKQKDLKKIIAGTTHPPRLLANYQSNKGHHWSDDIRDIHHRFPIAATDEKQYGAWFTRAQDYFRRSFRLAEKLENWNPFDPM